MHTLHRLLLILVTTILAIAAVLFMLPVPANVTGVDMFRVQLMLVSSFSLNYFAAAVLFLYGVRGFKPEMSRAYRITTISMAFFGLANIQYPILVWANLIPGIWLTYGYSLAIVIPGVLLHYIGVRTFMSALGVKSAWTSWQVLSSVLAVTCLAAVMLPHVFEIPEQWFSLHQLSCAINMTLNFFTAIMLFKLLPIIGPAYRGALRWMAAAVTLSTLGFAHVLIAALFGQNNDYTNLGSTAIPFVFVAIMYLVAGYEFCKIRLYVNRADKTGETILDAAVALASLASNQNDINHITERIRDITTNRNAGEAFSPESRNELAHICLDLQTYLVTKERLQTFTVDGLRTHVSNEALKLIDSVAFERPNTLA